MEEVMIFGVDTNKLHWKNEVVSKVRDLWEDCGKRNEPDKFEYDSLLEFLDAELPSPLSYRECGSPWAYIGIVPYFPYRNRRNTPSFSYGDIRRSREFAQAIEAGQSS